jgi:sugar phosphate permease
MKRYLISLIVMVLALVLASFAVMWLAPERFLVAMPLLALYFGVLCGLQHLIVTRAMNRSPKIFIQVFLGSVVAVLFIHIIVLAAYLFTHPSHAHLFTLSFCIGYAVSLVFETVALVQFVNAERRRRQQTAEKE